MPQMIFPSRPSWHSILCAWLSLCLLVLPSPAQVFVHVGAIKSVFLIKRGSDAGTGFILSVDGNPYLVTAAHVVKNLKSNEKLSIRKGWDEWQELVLTRIPFPGQSDIAAFASEQPIAEKGVALEFGSVKGQNFALDVFFLGFPFGGDMRLTDKTYRLASEYQEGTRSFPIALIKRGIISGRDNRDSSAPIIYVDAMNNPGFSGSPLLFWDQAAKVSKVIGVISGRLPEPLMVAEGVLPPPAYTNSGIVIAYDIGPAVEAIRKWAVDKP